MAASGQVEAYDAATGISLMGASVSMRNVATGVTYSGVTDSDPNQQPHLWVTPPVEDGSYVFTVTAAGYRSFTETDPVGGTGWGLAFPLILGSAVDTTGLGRTIITGILAFAGFTIVGGDSPKKGRARRKASI